MTNFNTFSVPNIEIISSQSGYQYPEPLIESFLADRTASGCSPRTIRYYRPYLRNFLNHIQAQGFTRFDQVSGDTIRRYQLLLQEKHNPGGVHAAYRAIKAFFKWIEFEELMPQGWKNPICKVRPPKVPFEIHEPISLQDVSDLLKTCIKPTDANKRDCAIFLMLLDTGMRAQELCDLNLADVDFTSGKVIIRRGKGQKGRICFISPSVSDSIQEYLTTRNVIQEPLFLSFRSHRLTYDGLRQMLERRIKVAHLPTPRSLHDFRRAFALNMLRNGVDIYSLQRLMGHSDLTVLRRYLAQNEDDIHLAHNQGSPVDTLFKSGKMIAGGES